MFILNRNGDKTTLEFRLIFHGGTPCPWYEFIQLPKVISQLIFEILEKSFLHSTSLEQFFPNCCEKLGDLKKKLENKIYL